LGLRRLTLRADVGNAASLRVAEKVGFARSGLDRAAGLLGDGSINHDVRFDLLAEEFDPGGGR
jgi:RimJ/RimL family protein N-acetyltransferase